MIKMDQVEKRELEEIIVQVIKTVYDPEIPVDVYELGLIYDIRIDDDANVEIDMTLTSPNCPVAETLPQEVRDKVGAVSLVGEVKLEIVFEPTWDRHMMSEEAQIELGMI